jgi:cell division protein FtsL
VKEKWQKITVLMVMALSFLYLSKVAIVKADEIEELGKQIAAIEASLTPLKSESTDLSKKIASLSGTNNFFGRYYSF